MRGLDKLKYAVASFIKGGGSYEEAVNSFSKELQKTLISADVNVRVVLNLTKEIKEKALETEPPPGILKREWFVKIVYDSLVQLFGGEAPEVTPRKLPWILMLVGIQGSGKTTTAGKIAYFYKRRGYRPGLITTDTYRPAAYDQLKQISEQLGVPFYGERDSKDPVRIASNGLKHLLKEGANIIIVDTAGRHGYGEEEYLLKEMEELGNAIKPDEVMLVIDAYIGQKAYDLAKRFHERTPIGSITITKLDGTAKGGGAISAVAATGARIKFVGDGEKLEDLEPFNPRKFVSRLLGLGDLETLLDKFKALEESEELERRWEKAILTGRLTLRDLYAQIKSLKKLGPLRKVLQMIPGLSMMPIDDDKLHLSEEKMDKWLHIMESMTYSELDNPHIIDRSRIRRIALGSGTSPEDVKELLNYYEATKKMLKTVKRRKGIFRRLGVGNVFG
ncbi:MAG: signal recognition particle protein [Desulfurococcales archaeon]|nr:signal recognition particle protein [Desulfurococcales archaeon]